MSAFLNKLRHLPLATKLLIITGLALFGGVFALSAASI